MAKDSGLRRSGMVLYGRELLVSYSLVHGKNLILVLMSIYPERLLSWYRSIGNYAVWFCPKPYLRWRLDGCCTFQ